MDHKLKLYSRPNERIWICPFQTITLCGRHMCIGELCPWHLITPEYLLELRKRITSTLNVRSTLDFSDVPEVVKREAFYMLHLGVG